VAPHPASEFGKGSADWSKAYLEYLTRSTAQSARVLKLYQQVLESVSHGHLAPTVFQDHYLQFSQTHWPEYAEKLAQLNANFLSDLIQLGTTYSQEQTGLAEMSFEDADLRPPQFNAADAATWFQQLGEYAGRLNARALKAYRAELDRVAAGETTPSDVQEATAKHLSHRLPAYLEQLGKLYFDLVSGLTDVRVEYEEEYFLRMLETANRQDESQPLVLNLSAPLGKTTSASLEVENSTQKQTTIRCSITDVRRSDGVGPAFAPRIMITPEALDLAPGEAGSIRISLQLDESKYDAGALYSGILFITGQSELPVEVLLRIIGTPPMPRPRET
jgi:hypothetical protein